MLDVKSFALSLDSLSLTIWEPSLRLLREQIENRLQWGLENRTWKTERHPNTERFKSWFEAFGFRMVGTIRKPT